MDNTNSKLNTLATIFMVLLVGTASLTAFTGGAAAATVNTFNGQHSGGAFSNDYTTETTWDGVDYTNGTTKTFDVYGEDTDVSDVQADDVVLTVGGTEVTPDNVYTDNGTLKVDYTHDTTETVSTTLTVDNITVSSDTEVVMGVDNTSAAINVDKVHHDVDINSLDGLNNSLNADITAGANGGASYDNRTNVSNATFTIVEGNAYGFETVKDGYGSIEDDNALEITDVVNASSSYDLVTYEQVSKTFDVNQPDGTEVEDGGEVWVWYDDDSSNYHYETTENGTVTFENVEQNHDNITVNAKDYTNASENNTQDYQQLLAKYDTVSDTPDNLTLEDFRTVTVNVQDVNDANLSEGGVTLSNDAENYSETANVSNGTATFENVSDTVYTGFEDGNYMITVDVDGYDSVSRYVTVSSDTETTAKLAETGSQESSYFVGVGDTNGGGLIGDGDFSLPSQVPDWISNPIESLVNGIINGINNIIDNGVNGVQSEIDDFIKSVQDSVNYSPA